MRSVRGALALATTSLLACAAPAAASISSPAALPFTQNWSNAGLITTNDTWSGVAGVEGYLGNDVTSATGADPRTLTAATLGDIDVNANQKNPDTFTAGGVTELEIANPTIALAGSGTADAPSVVFAVNGTNKTNIAFSANIRDVDGSSDDAVQQVAVQYRTTTSAGWTNVSGGYVADATTADAATKVTPLALTLPAAANNQPVVQIRVLTTNASGADELVGIDDVSITSGTVANPAPQVTCGDALSTLVGTAATREITAVDSDGTVTAIALPSSPNAGIRIGTTTPATAAGGTAKATLTVDSTVPAGTYQVLLRATNNSSPAQTGECTLTVTVNSTNDNGATRIHAIQGSGMKAALTGTRTIQGVVIGIDDEMGASNNGNEFPSDRGIWVQEETADQDDDPSTSEGIFVGNVNASNYQIGQIVRATGTAGETFGLTSLQATGTQPTIIAAANPAALPAPVEIDVAKAESQAVTGAGSKCGFPSDVCSEGHRAYYESLEGMRVRLATGTANSGGTNRFGELFLTPGETRDRVLRTDDKAGPGGTPNGQIRALIGADADAGSGNPSNPRKSYLKSTTLVKADLFDKVENLVGPLGFSFTNYKIMNQADVVPAVTKGPTPFPFPGATPPSADTVRVTSFNVENFFGVGRDHDDDKVTQAEYDEKRDRIVDVVDRLLQRPDVVGVAEVDSLGILQDVADELSDGTTTYEAHLIEGNDGRGIDNGFLVKSTVTATNVRQFGADVPSSVDGCSNDLFKRPPLGVDIDAGRGVKFTAITNHFASKGSDAEGTCKEAQATYLAGQVKTLETGGKQVIVMGDINAFEDEQPLANLVAGNSLTNQWSSAPAEERYSFQFNGRLQTLDHMLITDGLEARKSDFRYAHFDVNYYSRETADDGHRVSDHDPAFLTLDKDTVASAPSPGDIEPAISGTAADGATLTTTDGTWNGTAPITFAYQWQRCEADGSACADIAGATAKQHTAAAADVGKRLVVRVTATNAHGSASATSEPTAVVAGLAPTAGTTAPAVSGTARDGSALTATDGTWNGTAPITFAYQWQRCEADGSACADIAGATAKQHTAAAADVGKRLVVRVTATNAHGSASATSEPTAVVGALAPAAGASAPAVTGTPRDGSALTATDGTWNGTAPITFAYQWQRCAADGTGCADIAGAAAKQYTAGAADAGKRLAVKVTATNGAGSATQTSAPSAVVGYLVPQAGATAPQVSGTAQEGQQLTTTLATFTGTAPIAVTQRWQRCTAALVCVDIAGATGTTYTVTAADVGTYLRSVVTGTNGGGKSDAASAPTAVVTAKPPLGGGDPGPDEQPQPPAPEPPAPQPPVQQPPVQTPPATTPPVTGGGASTNRGLPRSGPTGVSATFTVKRGTVRIANTNAFAVKGELVLTRGGKVIARGTFSAAAGKTVQAKLRRTKAGRKARLKGRLEVRIRDTAGTKRTIRLTV